MNVDELRAMAALCATAETVCERLHRLGDLGFPVERAELEAAACWARELVAFQLTHPTPLEGVIRAVFSATPPRGDVGYFNTPAGGSRPTSSEGGGL